MLKHKYVRLFFLLLFVVTVVADYWLKVPLPVYAFLLFLYLLVTFSGSYFIKWNYFFDSIHRAENATKKIAITFDDAPLVPFTPQVLDLLKEHNIKALFFLIGSQIKGNEAIVKRILDEGHVIGNHSYSHENLFPIFSTRKMLSDVQRCDEEILKVTGKKVNLFRPPFGVTNPKVAAVVTQQQYISVGWSLRSFDTSIKDKNKLMQRCLVSLRGGDVVLFHDWGLHTLSILPQWIAEVKKKGLQFERADVLLNVEPYKNR